MTADKIYVGSRVFRIGDFLPIVPHWVVSAIFEKMK
jgi:hypothetical protein